MAGPESEDSTTDSAAAELYREEDSGPKPRPSGLDLKATDLALVRQAQVEQGKELGTLRQQVQDLQKLVTESETRIHDHLDEVLKRIASPAA